MKNKHTIALLGAGNLGVSIAQGLASSGFLNTHKLTVTKRNITRITDLPSEIKVTSDNVRAVLDSDVIILCVQPGQLSELLSQIKRVLKPEQHTIVSTITGISIKDLEERVGPGFAIIRAMPNTATAVKQSMTCLAANTRGKSNIDFVKSIFDCTGQTIEISEELMQAATVICASGIAFWMRFIRAGMQAAVQLGFDAHDAQALTVQTCLGAASLLNDKDSHPELEIDKVTTPKGCTIAGLNEMEHHGLSSALIKGVTASYERINSMRKM